MLIIVLAAAHIIRSFQGTLPEHVCQLTSLNTIAFDGLSSNEFCPEKHWLEKMLGRKVAAHLGLANSMSGSIPNCLWNISALRNIHLSGNGMLCYHTLTASILCCFFYICDVMYRVQWHDW